MDNNLISEENNFILNIDGFEGPIEVLLDLSQKSEGRFTTYINFRAS